MKPQASTFALSVVALSLGSASAAERPGVEHNVAKYLQFLEGGPSFHSFVPVAGNHADFVVALAHLIQREINADVGFGRTGTQPFHLLDDLLGQTEGRPPWMSNLK